jgi:hypothetical protein
MVVWVRVPPIPAAGMSYSQFWLGFLAGVSTAWILGLWWLLS